MTGNKKPTYEELEQRLAEAETIVATLRKGEVDAIVSERNVALLRVAELEKALQQAQRRLDLKNQIANIFLTVPDDEMYGEVLQVVLDAMESKHGVFGYVREDGAVVVPSLTRDIWDKCQILGKDIVFPRETWGGIWGRALVKKKTFYSNKDFRVPKGHIPVHRAMATPIIYRRRPSILTKTSACPKGIFLYTGPWPRPSSIRVKLWAISLLATGQGTMMTRIRSCWKPSLTT